MDVDNFEDKLIVKLNSVFLNSIEVRSYPDSFDNYVSQLTHAGGAILVAWQGAGWELPEGNNQSVLVQDGVYTWQFTTLKQNLSRGKNQTSSYNTIMTIKDALSGFTPAGFDDSSVLFPVDAGFLDKIKGFYAYQITMGHTLEESEV